jgi:hypothetical protein
MRKWFLIPFLCFASVCSGQYTLTKSSYWLDFTATATKTITPKFTFSSGTATVYINGVFNTSLTSGVAGSIAVNASDSVQYRLSRWESVTLIDLSNDSLSGSWESITLPTGLTYLHLGSNSFTGAVGDNWTLPTGLTYLHLGNNSFTGAAGDNWTVPIGLTELQLYDNSFTGDLSSWPLPSGLVVLYLHNNSFTGDLSSWPLPSGLTQLYLHNNSFTGDLSSWPLPSGLTYLYLHNNSFTGDLSSWPLPSGLVVLYLHNNSFTGDVSVWILPSGLTYLSLRDNSFTGDVSVWILPSGLTQLSLYDNSFTYASTGGAFTGVTSAIDTFLVYTNAMSSGNVDNMLVDCDTSGISNESINVGGTNAAPGAVGLAAKTSLESKGWTVTITAP